MALDLRTKLNGFTIETLRQHLAKIEKDSTFSYYADVIRAFLSTDTEEVAKYQHDERSQVAIAACCNPLADLEFLNSNFKKFALVAAFVCRKYSISWKQIRTIPFAGIRRGNFGDFWCGGGFHCFSSLVEL
ncbi:MAG: hypothetical protein D4R83_08870 [Streptomycetaceae bacterium]|nr:MAG: hypothetical protein D4R83_08870 [Streptomycetaceae bacterium]